MKTIKFIALIGFILCLNACNDNGNTLPSEEKVLSLSSLKSSLPQSLLNSNILIYVGKDGKEIEVNVEYLETISAEKHHSGLNYKREQFLIKLTNNVLKINTSLSGSSELTYGDVNQESYTATVTDNNDYKEALKNTILLSFIDKKSFYPDNLVSTLINKEILFGKEYDGIMKSRKLSDGEAGTRFNEKLGIVSLVDYDNNMYVIKAK